jgi:hypothetical protein
MLGVMLRPTNSRTRNSHSRGTTQRGPIWLQKRPIDSNRVPRTVPASPGMLNSPSTVVDCLTTPI